MAPHADAARRRVTPARRLDEVVEAAARVFAAKGYRRAQMSDVARELGVSAGNLYNYVPGKETLFALVLRRGVDGPLAEAALDLPVETISRADGVAWLARRLDFVSDFPAMEAALAGPAPRDAAGEVRAVVAELHEVLERVAGLLAVIERSAPDVPELGSAFLDVRRELFSRMARYVEARVAQGAFRPLEDPAVTARLVVELANWSAVRHPRADDPVAVSPEAARNAVADMAVHALVAA